MKGGGGIDGSKSCLVHVLLLLLPRKLPLVEVYRAISDRNQGGKKLLTQRVGCSERGSERRTDNLSRETNFESVK